MGRKLVNNPIHGVVHYQVPEEVREKIAALESELIRERAIKSSGVKEVIKFEEKIIYKDDPDLLKRFNEAMAELGRFKMNQRNISLVSPETIIQNKEVIREVEREVFNKKQAIILASISFLSGSAFILIIEKLIGFPIM